jgi:hypothetical protein
MCIYRECSSVAAACTCAANTEHILLCAVSPCIVVYRASDAGDGSTTSCKINNDSYMTKNDFHKMHQVIYVCLTEIVSYKHNSFTV